MCGSPHFHQQENKSDRQPKNEIRSVGLSLLLPITQKSTAPLLSHSKHSYFYGPAGPNSLLLQGSNDVVICLSVFRYSYVQLIDDGMTHAKARQTRAKPSINATMMTRTRNSHRRTSSHQKTIFNLVSSTPTLPERN